MVEKQLGIDWNMLPFENAVDNLPLALILNSLPFGLSVQNKNRVIIYENEKAKELTGSYKTNHCFKRWNYITGEGSTICKDCPATISMLDGENHKVFRKTIAPNQNDLFLEIQVIPILEKDKTINRYIEIISDVSANIKVKSLTTTPISQIIEDLQFSLSIYGKLGGEIHLKDELKFFDNPEYYIQKLSMFTYIGVFQNNFNREGLFGPLPVLDLPEVSMMVYSFTAQSDKITDPRRGGLEPCLFLTYFDRKDYFLFEKREEILNYLNKAFEGKKLEELDEEWFKEFKNSYRRFLSKLLNKFEMVH